MKIIDITSVSVLGILAAPFLVPAETLFSEDFESYTSGEALPTGANGSGQNWVSNTPDGTLTAETDSTNFFGEGLSNQYGHLSAFDATGNIVAATTYFSPGTKAGQFSLQFYDPSGSSDAGDMWGLRMGRDPGNTNTVFALSFDQGQLRVGNSPFSPSSSTYSLDSLNQLDIVFNNNLNAYSYAGGTVTAGAMDIYLNGVLIGDNMAGTGLRPDEVIVVFDFVGRRTPFDAPFTDTLYIDNLLLTEEAVVPEPSVFSLLVGGLGLLAAMSRRVLCCS